MSTSQVQIVMPSHVNGSQRLFGGQLMAWIDVVAAVEARHHTRRQVTTVSVDHLQFLEPAFIDDVIRLDACITWSGKTSLEVRVDSKVVSLNGSERLANRAYIVFVALDEDGNPCAFDPFVPTTDDEKAEYEEAEKRRAERMSIRLARLGSL